MKTAFRHSLAILLFSSVPAFAEESAENIGFPQLKQVDTFAGQVFWLAVSFLVLFALMSKVALPKVGSVLEQRHKQRADDLSEAEHTNAEAAKIRHAYEASLAKSQAAAQALITAAEHEIAAKMAAGNATFGENARKRVVAAEDTIAKAKQNALGSLADISADIAAEMAGRVAGLQVSKADAKQAVTTLMQKAS